MLIHWNPATEFTKDVFNRWGAYPYHAVLECAALEDGFASYDLTVLRHDDGAYSFAHGCAKDAQRFPDADSAATAAVGWYLMNRQPAARRT